MFAAGLVPPYYAVIFASRLRDDCGYAAMADRMDRLAAEQPGYLGIESARSPDGLGLTVSYWESEEAMAAWRRHADHVAAQAMGIERFYEHYEVRIARVDRAYAGPPAS